LRSCLKFREEKQPDRWTTFHTQLLLGSSLLGQQRYADAEPLLLAGYKGLDQRRAQVPVQDQGLLLAALERLVQLYEATGHEEQAAAWRTRLDAARQRKKPSPD
jgi:hypothetical protein